MNEKKYEKRTVMILIADEEEDRETENEHLNLQTV